MSEYEIGKSNEELGYWILHDVEKDRQIKKVVYARVYALKLGEGYTLHEFFPPQEKVFFIPTEKEIRTRLFGRAFGKEEAEQKLRERIGKIEQLLRK